MAINGITFDYLGPTSADHGTLFAEFSDGIVKGCTITFLGTNISVSSGYLNICGRLMKLASTQTIAVTGTSGYARVRAQIDMNHTITVTVEGEEVQAVQPTFEVDYSATLAGFPALTTEDINVSGEMYQVEFCIAALSVSGVSEITRSIAKTALKMEFGGIGSSATDSAGVRTILSVPTLGADGKVIESQTKSSVTGVSDNHTLSSAEAGTFCWCYNTTDITITLPSGYDAHAEVEIARGGTGNVTITPAENTTLYGIGINGSCKITDQYGVCAVKNLGGNVWLITGSVESAT